MSTRNTKRRAGSGTRLLAGVSLGTTFLILFGAGVYSRPSAANTTAKEVEPERLSTALTSETDSSFVALADKKRSTKRNRPAPPPPPPPPATPIYAIPPSHAAPPAPPAPAAPPAPFEDQKDSSDKRNKDKASKEKSKEKVVKGDLIEAPSPIYPQQAKKQRIEGMVTVAIVIGDDGSVISAKAKSGPELLYGAAEEAAAKARFKPTKVNGKPAKVAGAMTYNFVLDKK